MKLRFLPLLILAISVTTFAQKKEIRKAGRAVDKEDFEEANDLLAEVSDDDLSSLNDRFKGRYYLAKGNTLLGLNTPSEEDMEQGNMGDINFEDLKEAAENFSEAMEYGEEDEAEQGLAQAREFMVNSGVEDQNSENFEDASKKIHAAYELNPQDTIYLFAAANNAFNAEDFDTAIGYYEELVDLGFKGNAKQYLAVDKESGETQAFEDEEQRDLMVKSGDYEDPSEEQEDAKDTDIIRQLAAAYFQIDEKDKAIDAIQKVKEKNPDDVEILQAEAQIYQEMEDYDKFYELIEDLLEKDTDKAGEYYAILGDGALDEGDEEKAQEYYEKAVEEDPEMGEAYDRIANLILAKQEDIVKEMNELGMSDEDQAKYDELDEDRNDLLKEALPYMEKAYEHKPEDPNVLRTLYQMNRQLDNEEEAEKFKQKMEEASQN